MISAADFPEVFPSMRDQEAGRPAAYCIARWEDDGGRCLEFSWGLASADLADRTAGRSEDGPAERGWSLEYQLPYLRVRLRASRR